MVDQGVIILGLHAQLGEIVDDIVVELHAVAHILDEHIGHIGVKLGIGHQTGGVDKVVRGDGGIFLAVAGIPFGVLAQTEGPLLALVLLAVRVRPGLGLEIPGFRQTGDHIAEGIIFHQRIHKIGQRLLILRNRGGQVVHGGDLRGVEVAVFRVFGIGDAAVGVHIGVGLAGAVAVAVIVVGGAAVVDFVVLVAVAAVAAACAQADQHEQSQHQSERFLHGIPLLFSWLSSVFRVIRRIIITSAKLFYSPYSSFLPNDKQNQALIGQFAAFPAAQAENARLLRLPPPPDCRRRGPVRGFFSRKARAFSPMAGFFCENPRFF